GRTIAVIVSRRRNISTVTPLVDLLCIAARLQHKPLAGRWTINRQVGFAIAIIIARNGNVGAVTVQGLAGVSTADAGRQNVPAPFGGPIEGQIGLGITVEIVDRSTAGSPRRRTGWWCASSTR